MPMEQINVSVDAEVASAYRAASESERSKLDLLVSLRLRDATSSQQSLREVAREVSRSAQQRGLTPEILEAILDEQ